MPLDQTHPAPAVTDAASFQLATGATDAQIADIETYRQILADWNTRMNLVGPSAMADFWGRHAFDSAQLLSLAPEGMNIPTLNAVLLATPKSNIEQSVGRILRLKPEDRTIQPIIFDVLDSAFVECYGQWTKRKKFYTGCGYTLRWKGETQNMNEPKESEPKGVCLFVDDDSST